MRSRDMNELGYNEMAAPVRVTGSARQGRLGSLVRAAVLTCLFACGGKAQGPAVEEREVTVACGRCIFEMPEAASLGCPWAIELDGKRYLVQGQVPQGHQNHAPDGMCNMPRRAVVSGQVRGDRFISTKFALRPAKNVPSDPRFTEEDLH